MNTNNTQISFRKLRTVLAMVSFVLVSGHVCSQNTAPGNALDFDGTDDYITVSTGFPATSNFTFSVWVNLREYTNSKFFSSSAFEIGTKNGKLTMWVDPWGDEEYSNVAFKTNEWTYLAVTLDGSTVKYYINGVLDKIINTSVQVPAISAMTIGRHVRLNVNYLNGKMDELKFENVARTQEEIQASMYNVVPTTTAGLLAYYRFDEAAPVLTDLTGNNHNGELQNFALDGAGSNFVESYAMVVPTAVAAGSVSGTGFTANWTAPTLGTVENYLLDVSTAANLSSFVTGYEALNVNSATSYNVTGLEANTAYYYRVRANKTAAGVGASSNAIQVSTTTTGVNDVENTAFTVCPNPSKGQFNIVSDKEVKAVEVLNIAGKLVFKTTAVSDNTNIDLSNQTKGVYFVRVSFEDSVKTQRVCIE